MKLEIEEWKKKNGNSSGFTNKEMLIYLITKTDKVDEKVNKMYGKFEKGSGKIAENRTVNIQQDKSIGLLWKFVYGLIFAIIGLGFGVLFG